MAEVETLLRKENRQEAEEIVAFLEEMTPAERKEFLTFTRGARFARGLAVADRRPAGVAAQTV